MPRRCKSQDINSHGFDNIGYLVRCLLWGSILITYTITVSRNDIKCKYRVWYISLPPRLILLQFDNTASRFLQSCMNCIEKCKIFKLGKQNFLDMSNLEMYSNVPSNRVNSLGLGRCGSDHKIPFLNLWYGTVGWVFTVKFVSGEHHWTSLMIS